MQKPAIRPARPEDAGALAPLVNAAGEGLPLYFWTRTAERGQDPFEFGRQRIESDEAGISWRNTFVAEVDGAVAGCLITHTKPSEPDPIDADTPPVFRPLRELEAQALDTGYIYVLSVRSDMQGRGIGGLLIGFARRSRGSNGMSLLVADSNVRAKALYESHGYLEHARRPMVKNGWTSRGSEWILMINPD